MGAAGPRLSNCIGVGGIKQGRDTMGWLAIWPGFGWTGGREGGRNDNKKILLLLGKVLGHG